MRLAVAVGYYLVDALGRTGGGVLLVGNGVAANHTFVRLQNRPKLLLFPAHSVHAKGPCNYAGHSDSPDTSPPYVRTYVFPI